MKNPRYITVDTISDSDYNNRNRVYLGGGIAPTVLENHGKVTLVLVEVHE